MAVTETSRKAAHALEELYRNHVAEVYRYSYAMLGNRADAEDVTQTTFVNALRALERGETPRKPAHWLIAITHNLVRQRFRQDQGRPAPIEFDGDTVVTERAEPDGPTMHELVVGLQRIPPSQREALVLREFEGRSYKEIQELLGLSSGAVETLLFRARRSLAEELESFVTCELAELAVSKDADGRLSRKERRRLADHLRECPGCAHLAASQSKYRRQLKGLALLPLPFSLMFFKGAPSASAAAGLSTIGAGSGVAGGSFLGTAGGTAAGLAGGGAAGGLAAGGVLAKVAVVVAAVTLAGGVGYEGVKKVQHHPGPKRHAKAHAADIDRGVRPAVVRGSGKHTVTPSTGKALANGFSRSNSVAARTGRPGRTSNFRATNAADKTPHTARVPKPATGTSPVAGTKSNGKAKPSAVGSTPAKPVPKPKRTANGNNAGGNSVAGSTQDGSAGGDAQTPATGNADAPAVTTPTADPPPAAPDKANGSGYGKS
jgi:RNA polymerase sigma factor (sigma-70 family)